MALTELIFGIDKTTIGVIELDASVKETHTVSAEATAHPVEAAPYLTSNEVTDHVIVRPLTVKIEGVISDTPVALLNVVQNLITGNSFTPSRDAWEQFLLDIQNRRLVTIVTTLKDYPNMVLENVMVERDKDTGNSLHFTANAKQVQLVTLETIENQEPVKAPERSTKGKGTKPKKQANPKTVQKKQSTASAISDRIFGD